jgi:dipeptidyl aminopeptidase/acylaminoacyl peptidase
MYRAGEGVWPTLSFVNVNGGERKIILNGKEENIVFGEPDGDNNDNMFAVTGSSPSFPSDVFVWKQGEKLKRLTNLNPWLEKKSLGEQSVIK